MHRHQCFLSSLHSHQKTCPSGRSKLQPFLLIRPWTLSTSSKAHGADWIHSPEENAENTAEGSFPPWPRLCQAAYPSTHPWENVANRCRPRPMFVSQISGSNCPTRKQSQRPRTSTVRDVALIPQARTTTIFPSRTTGHICIVLAGVCIATAALLRSQYTVMLCRSRQVLLLLFEESVIKHCQQCHQSLQRGFSNDCGRIW